MTPDDAALLESLGYAETVPAGPGPTGVFVQDGAPRRIRLVGGWGPEVREIDGSGQVVARWKPDVPVPTGLWRSAHPVDEDLVIVIDGGGLVRLDPHGRVVWRVDGPYHHDLLVMPSGTSWALSRTAVDGLVHDLLVPFDPMTGRTGAPVDLLLAADAVGMPHAPVGDALHVNAVAPDPTGLLLSVRQTHALWRLDPRAPAPSTWWTGPWQAQHDPQPLPDGTILLFDNRGADHGSRVLSLQPTGAVVTLKSGFDSAWCGAIDPLPDGGLLVTDSVRAEVVELSPEGAIRWAWRSPWRAGHTAALVTEARWVAPAGLGPTHGDGTRPDRPEAR